MISVLLAALLAQGPPAASAASREPVAIVEAECSAIETRGGEAVERRIPGLRIVEATAASGPLVLDVAPDASIVCPRSSIVPAPNDWKVPMAGHPLYIIEMGVDPSARRVGVLDAPRGHFHYRLVQGAFRGDEGEQVTARLNRMQESARR